MIDASRARKLLGRGSAGYHYVYSSGSSDGITSLWDKEVEGDVRRGAFSLSLRCCFRGCVEWCGH